MPQPPSDDAVALTRGVQLRPTSADNGDAQRISLEKRRVAGNINALDLQRTVEGDPSQLAVRFGAEPAVALLQKRHDQRQASMSPLSNERQAASQVPPHPVDSGCVGRLVRPEVFVSTAEVASRLGDPGVRIVDCRWTEDGAHDAYIAEHLPGAMHCDWSRDLSAPPPTNGHPRWMLLGPDEFAATMGRLGIGNDTTVIGYDLEGGHHAARLWLALRRYGHDRMAVMDGGLTKWRTEGRPVESGEVGVPQATFVAAPRSGVIASKEEVLSAVRSGLPWLLDVRRATEYTGEEARAARGGHIPGAVHILWRDALRDDWTLRDADELDDLYADAGFGADTRTITYCQAGVRAAFTHLVLHAIGRDDVRTYDGSWEEWGNDPSLPVVKGRS